MPSALGIFTFALASGVHLAAQQSQVVPALHANTDAPAYGWVAGASRDVRQQTLIAPFHLTNLVGRSITALELRRHAADEPYAGGTADLTLTLSVSANQPVDCSNVFAVNEGPNAVQVFSGPIDFPTSPQPTGAVGWTADNIIRIEFATPFVYQGGTLCVDLVGHPISGQNANWWMADLDLEDIGGTIDNLGGGCGQYGGADKKWSYVSRRSLLPGAFAHFMANGTPNGVGLAIFGNRSVTPIPTSLLGIQGPAGCELWLSSLDASVPVVFAPPADPADTWIGGDAEVFVKIPNSATLYGATLTTQWVDLSQMALSNAIEWSVAMVAPSIGLALIEGHPNYATGLATPYMGHVMRFEYQ